MSIERAPTRLDEARLDELTYADGERALQLLADYYEWLGSHLGFWPKGSAHYVATEKDLSDRQQQLSSNREKSYFSRRSVYEVGLLVHASVQEFEQEFAHKTVLDIGCGEGRLGEAIARNSKARVTFLDNDSDMLARSRPSWARESKLMEETYPSRTKVSIESSVRFLQSLGPLHRLSL